MAGTFNFQLIRDLIEELQPYVENNDGLNSDGFDNNYKASKISLNKIIESYNEKNLQYASFCISDVVKRIPLDMFQKFEPVMVYLLQHTHDALERSINFRKSTRRTYHDLMVGLSNIQYAKEIYELTRFILVTRLELRLNFNVDLSPDIILNIENQMIVSIYDYMKKNIMPYDKFDKCLDKRIAELRAYPLQEVYATDRGPNHKTKRLLTGDRIDTKLRIKLRPPDHFRT